MTRLTTVNYGMGGAPQYTDGTPTVDGNGNVTNEITASRTETYTYDALNRLSTVNYGDGQTQSYTFDAMGNRLSRVDSVSGTTNYTVDAANRLTATTGTGASTYTNDLDGNTLTGGGRTNTWDSQNRMVSCIISGSSNTFKYGADGLRRQKTTNGTSTDYAYDATMMVREGHATGGSLTASTVTATYFQGASGPCYRRDDTQTESDGQGHTFGKTRWYVYDGLGSVVGELDPLGDLTSNPKYDVYGAVRGNGGTATSKHGFVGGLGHLSEAETGLVYMSARYMDPQTGRFVSQDPSKDGVNWFEYCGSNPVNEVDQTGKSPLVLIALAIGAAILTSAALTALLAGAFEAGRENIVNDGKFNWGQIDDAAAAGVLGSGLLGGGVGVLELLGTKGTLAGAVKALASVVPLAEFPGGAVAAVAIGGYVGELWGGVQLSEE